MVLFGVGSNPLSITRLWGMVQDAKLWGRVAMELAAAAVSTGCMLTSVPNLTACGEGRRQPPHDVQSSKDPRKAKSSGKLGGAAPSDDSGKGAFSL